MAPHRFKAGRPYKTNVLAARLKRLVDCINYPDLHDAWTFALFCIAVAGVMASVMTIARIVFLLIDIFH